MADGPGGQMSHRAMLDEHDKRMRRTKLRLGEMYNGQRALFRTGGNYTDKFVGYVDEGIADEIIRRYNEGAE